MSRRALLYALGCLGWLLASAPPVQAEPWVRLKLVSHLHTDFSTGWVASVEEAARRAEADGVDVLICTDHLLRRAEYGLFPFRHLIHKTVRLNAVMERGIPRYLAQIAEANRRHPGVLLLPGFEVSPFYYWSGAPLSRSFTLQGWHRHLLLFGLTDPRVLHSLPLVSNPGMPRKPWGWDELAARGPAGLLLIGLLGLARWSRWLSASGMAAPRPSGQRRGARRMGIGCLVVAALLIPDVLLPDPLFDPYHGDQGMRPFQTLIDTVRRAGGLVIWAHPWGGATPQTLGGVTVDAGPYFEVLAATDRYTGFEFGDTEIYGPVQHARPGVWDQLLQTYCRGARRDPVWIVADTSMPNHFADKATILWASARSPAGVLEAIRHGRMYGIVKQPTPLVLEACVVHDLGSGAEGTLGDRVAATGPVELRLRVGLADPAHPSAFHLTVVRDGAILYQTGGDAPWEGRILDDEVAPGHLRYYRVEVEDAAAGRIVANPIFVQWPSGGT